MHSKKKLSNKYIESFEIEDVVETQTYRLRLSLKWRIHSIFHVFLFEKYHINDFTESFAKVILMNDHEKWEIKKILDVKEKMSRYLIRWKEYSFCDNEWIKEKNLNNVDEMLATFKRKRVDIQLSFLVRKKKSSFKRSFTKIRFEIQKRKRRFVSMRDAKCEFLHNRVFVSHVVKSMKFIFLIVVLLRWICTSDW